MSSLKEGAVMKEVNVVFFEGFGEASVRSWKGVEEGVVSIDGEWG